MKIIFLLVSIYIFASAQSCYTVQVLSLPFSKTSEKVINLQSYDKSCQSMKIGKTLTVRCGCFEKYKDASDTLPQFRKEHDNAYVTTTYKKRFNQIDLKELKALEDKDDVKEIQVLKKEISDLRKKMKKNISVKENRTQAYILNPFLSVAHPNSMPLLKSVPKILNKKSLIKKEETRLVASSETCYSIQVLSLEINEENKKIFNSNTYDKTCRKMELSDQLTIRCACIDSYEEAEKALPYFTKKYKEAYLVSTYKYRFGKGFITKKVEKKVKSKKKNSKKKKKGKFNKKPERKSVYSAYLLPLSGSYKSSVLSGRYGSARLDYKYRFGAQMSYDIGYVNERPNGYSNHLWRRVRMFHKGNFFDEKLFYELEYSLTGGSSIKDLLLGYQDKIAFIDTSYRIKYGNIKIPFSLETYTSSKYITFMERALNDSFADGRKLGFEILLSKKLNKDRVNLFISTFKNSLNDDSNADPLAGYTSRLVYAKKFSKSQLLSVGFAFKKINYFKDNVKFSQGIESALGRENYVSTRIKDVDNVRNNNIELLYMDGRYSLQGEYVTTRVKSLKDGYYDFKAYYLQGSYFIFGKGSRYKMSTSTLAKISPTADGSLEFALRYSYIDLNDRDELGGTQYDMNYALNWYITKELKLMFNYTVAKPKGTDDYDGTINVYQARVLFAF